MERQSREPMGHSFCQSTSLAEPKKTRASGAARAAVGILSVSLVPSASGHSLPLRFVSRLRRRRCRSLFRCDSSPACAAADPQSLEHALRFVAGTQPSATISSAPTLAWEALGIP